MTMLLETGGEVYTKQNDDCRVYDRIKIANGVAKCINKQAYQKDYFPLSQIEAIHTHTSDEEESAEWW